MLTAGMMVFATLPPIAYLMVGRVPPIRLFDMLMLLPGFIAGVLFLICHRRSHH